jgi:hypothetical protein
MPWHQCTTRHLLRVDASPAEEAKGENTCADENAGTCQRPGSLGRTGMALWPPPATQPRSWRMKPS